MVSPMANHSNGTTTILRNIREEGGEPTWREFVARYEKVIRGYASSAGLPRHHVDDLTQTVLSDLVAMLPTLLVDKDVGTFRGLLKTIVRRKVHDHYRKTSRESEALGRLNHIGPAEADRDDIWEHSWHEGLLAQALTEVAGRTNPETFQAFELLVVSSVPAREVADLLGISVASVYQAKSRVSQAVQKVFNELAQSAD